ncbi:MAG: PKD domain-containing protein [Candidatus Hydrogenedentes bacterium]|nr:PKD domain-containing protein [Candidatus Hydrogenedentota bacterium]
MRIWLALSAAVLLCGLLTGCDTPAPDFSFAPADGDAPLAVVFTNLSQGGGPFARTYSWNFGDGSPAVAAFAPAHTYTVPGEYMVTLTMLSWLGTRSVEKGPVVVREPGGPDPEPIMVLSRSFSPATYQAGSALEVTLRVEQTGKATITSLGFIETAPAGWSFDGIASGDGPPIFPKYPVTGEYGFAYVVVPAFPVVFTYRTIPTADASGSQTFRGRVLYRTDGGQLESEEAVSVIFGGSAG